MSKTYLINEAGTFYKSNLHCHTTYSDGKLTPAQAKTLYTALGYSVVAYTDHNIYQHHHQLDDDRFLALAGFEVDINEAGTGKCYHFNAFATAPDATTAYIPRENADGTPVTYGLADINRYIEKLVSQQFLVMYNHPSWSLQTPDDFLGLRNLFAFEIYNHLCECENRTGNDSAYYSLMLRAGTPVYCTATDDTHGSVHTGGGYVMIKSPALTYAHIINSLRDGQFYASQGPEIYSLYVQDEKICCDCSPIRSAHMLTKYRYAESVHDSAGQITHLSFPFSKKQGLIRLVLVDAQNRTAYTNPYILSDV